MRATLTLAALCALLVCSYWPPPVEALKGGVTPQGARQLPNSKQAIFSGPCDTADILTLYGKDGVMQHAPVHVTALLKGRLYTCRALLRLLGIASPPPVQHPVQVSKLTSAPTPRPTPTPNPAPTPTPTPPPPLANLRPPSLITWHLATPMPPVTEPVVCNSTSSDPMVLYAALGICVAFIKALPTSTPSPSPSPITFRSGANGLPGYKVVYTMALAADAPSAAQLSVRTAAVLISLNAAPQPSPSQTPIPEHVGFDPITGDYNMPYVIAAQPSWTLAQYQQQCASDPTTAGAVVILAPGTQTAVTNFLLWATSWTKVTLQAMLLDCEPVSTTYLGNAAYITYVSGVHEATGPRTSIPLATYLAVLSAVTALHPLSTTGTTTSYTVATPSPPVYGKEYLSGFSQTSSTTTNPNSAIIVAASGFLNGLSTVNIGQQASNDVQLAKAADRILPGLISDLQMQCKTALPLTSPVTAHWYCYWFGWLPAPPMPVPRPAITVPSNTLPPRKTAL